MSKKLCKPKVRLTLLELWQEGGLPRLKPQAKEAPGDYLARCLESLLLPRQGEELRIDLYMDQPCIGTLVSSGVVISAKQWYRKTLELHPLLGATLIEKLQAALRSASWSAHEAFDHLNHTRWDGLGSDEALRESFLTALEKQIGRAPLPEELEDALSQEYDDLLTLEDVSEQLGESFCHSERIPDPELERLCVQNADFFALLETVRELEALPKLQFDNTRNGAMAHYIFATDQGWQDSADNLILETYTEEFSYYPESGEEPSWYFLPLNSQNLKALCDLMRCESRLMNRVMDLIMDPLEE